MQNFRFTLLFYPLLFLFISSCEYIPNGEKFTEINSDIPPPDVVLDLSFDSDTLLITDYPFTISYSADAGDNLVYVIFLLIGQDTLQADYDSNGHFIFSPDSFYEEGTHDLQMDVITNTNTGSLADVAGLEILAFEYHWTLIIENAW
jgi:hypothetical protein